MSTKEKLERLAALLANDWLSPWHRKERDALAVELWRTDRKATMKLFPTKVYSTPRQLECRRKTNAAIKHGQIARTPCAVCGNPKSQVHHRNYDDHMDVEFLCAHHHSELHSKARKLLALEAAAQ